MNARETIFAALFAKVATAAGLVTSSRELRLIDELAPAEMPALYQIEGKQAAVTRLRLPTIWHYHAELALYVHAQAAEQQQLPSIVSLLNNMVDAVIATIDRSPATGTQTLGGLVEDVRLSGDIEVIHGRMDDGRRSAAFIPLEIIPNI